MKYDIQEEAKKMKEKIFSNAVITTDGNDVEYVDSAYWNGYLDCLDWIIDMNKECND